MDTNKPFFSSRRALRLGFSCTFATRSAASMAEVQLKARLKKGSPLAIVAKFLYPFIF
jgi:predicted GIY-YIG superfamily endonuclease